MNYMSRLLLLPGLFLCLCTHAQVKIPGYTGYAVPAEDNDNMFSSPAGLQNWSGSGRQISYYFHLPQAGALKTDLMLRTDAPGAEITASLAGREFKLKVPATGAAYKKISLGSVSIARPGFYQLVLRGKPGQKGKIADIQSVLLSGAAAKNAHFNPVARRNAASVHLFYPQPDSLKIQSFYQEITIPAGADHLHSYYMACGFDRGYFGIQVNSPAERRVIFSVWDAGKEPVDRNKVAAEDRVKLIGIGNNVVADGFGNEGTGGHSHWVYNWKTETTYRFAVTALPDSATQSTTYSAYFFLPEEKKWKLIASFLAPKDGKYLRGLYSFVENFEGNNGQLYRKAEFGNGWVRPVGKDWAEITQSSFSYDATGKAGHRIDFGGGAGPGGFYLWNGGFQPANARPGDLFTRTGGGTKPLIDLTKNTDSAAQAQADWLFIMQQVKTGKIDTTGSREGVFYKILKEGDGPLVELSDTLVVNYKGSLLSNGYIFDQTKDKPATFPLKRLIRGWQLALPYCRKGGTIRIFVPSGAAYGIRNLGVIPPNSVLAFDIEVLDIKR